MRSAVSLLLFVVGCQEHPVVGVEYELPEVWECAVAADGEYRHSCLQAPHIPAQVDLLFVIGDSAATAPTQARLAASLEHLAERVEALDVPLDLRIGFTRGTAGHPACKPEAFGSGRLETCNAEGTWIDWSAGAANLNPLLSDELACAAAIGTDGCAFQSPLLAAAQTVLRAVSEGEPEFGFFRELGTPILVFVTDGLDCSAGDNEAAFDPDGARALWTDTSSNAPTPDVCWRGGVDCDEEGCRPAALDAVGQATTDPARANLRDVDAIVPRIAWALQHPLWLRPAAKAHLVVLGGVAPGFTLGDPIFATATDAVIPPVRTLQMAEQLAAEGFGISVHSVLERDLSGFADTIADAIEENAPPPCVPLCLADEDEGTPGLQADCRFTLQLVEPPRRIDLPQCNTEAAAPSRAPACFTLRTDESLHPSCAAKGANAEVRFHWSQPIPLRSHVSVDCRPSRAAAADCPQ